MKSRVKSGSVVPTFEEFTESCKNEKMLARPLKLIANINDEEERREKERKFFEEKYDLFLKRFEAKKKEAKKKELGVFGTTQVVTPQKKANKKEKKKRDIPQVEGQMNLDVLVSSMIEKKQKTEDE